MRASGGSRIEWTDIPTDVRAAVEHAVGASVVAAVNQAGGFSPGLAARCRLSNDERVFVKAVSPAQNPMSTRIHRREAEVAAALPPAVPAPRLRHVLDDGTWVALVFDDVEGRQPSEPWTLDDLDVVLPAVRVFHETVTPTPAPHLQSVQDRHRPVFNGWRRFASGDGDVARLPSFARDNLDRLATIESAWETAAAGDTLIHADLRADNLLIDAAGSVWLVDWPWACTGAAFVDLAFLLPSVGLGDGPAPSVVAKRYGLFSSVEPEALQAVVAAAAGFFSRSALDPAPPGLPNLRAFQQAQADVALRWLEDLAA